MEPTLFRFILKYSTPQQIILTVLALVAQIFIFIGLELPKTIMDDVIQGDAATFPVSVAGMNFGQIQYLLLLCGAFLGIVIINQGFKYIINIYRGITAERMLRRLRYQLYDQLLRFPAREFRTVSQGEVIPMITAEAEPVGGFVGDSISLPVFQGGTLLTILIFLFIQSPILAFAATSLYPLQVYIIPRLQARVNRLAKKRIRLVRQLSDHIGETVSTIEEVHLHHTSQFERARLSKQLGKIFHVRYQIYLWKFIIKFINNFINQLGPFTFYAIGGYLVITGDITIGALVAGLAAHKDLASPWKELLTYYQRLSDTRIKYEQIVSQFEPEDMIEPADQIGAPDTSTPFGDTLTLENIKLEDETGLVVLARASAELPLTQSVAIVGDTSVSGSELARIIAGLTPPSGGRLTIQDQDVSSIPEAIWGQRVGYIGTSTTLGSGTLGDLLIYPLRHESQEDLTTVRNPSWQRAIKEAYKSGNTPAPVSGDWIDGPRLGWRDPTDHSRRVHEVLTSTHMLEDVFDFGLNGIIDPTTHGTVADAALQARQLLQKRLSETHQTKLVEPFVMTKYMVNATVSENLVFGHYIGGELTDLTHHPFTEWVLDREGLTRRMLGLGYQVAETMTELFDDGAGVSTDLIEQFSFIRVDDLPDYKAILDHVTLHTVDDLKGDDRRRILSLPFMLIPARHRLGLMTPLVQQCIISARRTFNQHLPPELRDHIDFFRPETFTRGGTVLDNILFGRLVYEQANAKKIVYDMIREIGHAEGLFDTLVQAGLVYPVGVGASRLNRIQRQKMAISRTLLKKPDLLVLDQALSGLPRDEAHFVLNALQREQQGKGFVAVLPDVQDAIMFDYTLVLDQGRIIEAGATHDLMADATSSLSGLLDSGPSRR